MTKITTIRGTTKPTERDYKLNELYRAVMKDENLEIVFDNTHFFIIEFKENNFESIKRAKEYMKFKYPNEIIIDIGNELIIYPQ